MKITKTSCDVKAYNKRREIANIGCNVCPCCGETKTVLDCIKSNRVGEGIDHCFGFIIKGFFRVKYFRIDKYECFTCGAKWESDPYEYDSFDL